MLLLLLWQLKAVRGQGEDCETYIYAHVPHHTHTHTRTYICHAARAHKSITYWRFEMLAMQTNYPPLPSDNEPTSTTSSTPTGGNANSAARYPPSQPPPTSSSLPFPGQPPMDNSFSRGGPATETPTSSLNEVLHRSLMASSFAASDVNEQGIPRAHSNGKPLDLNALREVAGREKRLFEFDSDRKDPSQSGYDFPFQMAAHSQWSNPLQHQIPGTTDNHHTDMPTRPMPTSDATSSNAAKMNSFTPNVGVLPYSTASSAKDLDYLLAANAARALVNHLGGGNGAAQAPDDRDKSSSMGFRDMSHSQIPQHPVSTMEQQYAHQRQPSDSISPSRNAFGLPSLGAGPSDGAPPNMSAPFNTSPLPFPVPPHFRQQQPHHPPPHHLLPPNPFGGLDPGFADRMKDYSTPHQLMDPRYGTPGGMPRLPRSASPMDGDGRGGMMGESAMSDASPNSSTSGKFVSPHSQGAGGSSGNIVLYPWMNPKSCGECFLVNINSRYGFTPTPSL